MDALTNGAVAGLLATVPMTAAMRAAHDRLPRHQRYSLLPEQIAHRVSRLVGSSARPHEPGWAGRTYVAHFGFGAAFGVTAGRLPGRPAAKGGRFGSARGPPATSGGCRPSGCCPQPPRRPPTEI